MNRQQSEERPLRDPIETPLSIFAMKVVTTFYRRFLFMEYSLQKPVPRLKFRLPVEIEELEIDQLAEYRRFRPRQSTRDIELRVARGDRCFACWHDNKIVDVGWIATGRVYLPFLRSDLLLEKGDVYNYDSYTLPDYRRHGLYMARNAFIAKQNRKEGYTRSVALVAVENRTPHLALLMAGLRPVGTYFCLRLGLWQRTWQRPEAGRTLPPLVAPQTCRSL